ncbi:helix-turn-helix transcriptional regulator [Vibrio metschnikovii]|uniref:helix-turn-helix transcriptional regulator n=1 Tax=Vibrio metschnikovii TaxID=28172 RepID=UPI002A675073|nr:helix-turn-helix transcriptional regulator [Vibrio metschnikovii]EKO3721409.1 helix-turn-helix transcriptional regulator [Vibrio metschnikovii]EKO3725902.1 helix-turn-helix transcriptional regulator [Vibrio metschnikovii]EKO3879155.1 helix-turn-helix transcriptional regulator [Vibrio metschnikovii]ELZ5772603.1 helix-turn-helix transcriptional regulator [Vibrio metschnikovii]
MIELMVHIDNVRSNFSLRLAQACSNAGIEEHGRGVILARKLGVTPKAVSKWLNAESMPRPDKMTEIARILGVSLSWLQLGEDKNEVRGNAELIGNMQVWDSRTPLGDDEVAIPFLSDVRLSAGNGFICDTEQDNGYRLRFAKSTLRRYNVDPVNAKCVSVKGDSMEPVLPDGSTVGIDCGNKTLVDGKIFAINHNGELFIKKLYRLPGGGLRIYSFNELEYPPREYAEAQVLEQGITIVGRVFWYSVML